MERRTFLSATAMIGAVGDAGSLHGSANGSNASESATTEHVLMKLVRQRFSNRLSIDQYREIDRQLKSNEQAAASLKRVALSNADEPVLAPSSAYRMEQRQ